MATGNGYKKHIEKEIKRIFDKLKTNDDKWGSDFLIHTNNAKKHFNLCCGLNNEGKLFAPLPIKRAYMNEIWLSELPPPPGVDTQELLNHVITPNGEEFKKALQAMSPSMKSEELESWFITMTNLYVAVDEIFDESYDKEPLSESLVTRIHSKLANGVLESPGVYRTVEVGAAGSSVHYVTPAKIRSRLLALIEVINEKLSEITNFGEAVALGGFFFSEFLLTHPFRDGNGRTARLLLSHLLRHWTVVPISLYLRSNREFYIKAMQSRTGTGLPLDVLTYVAQCIEETVLLHHRDSLDDSIDEDALPIEKENESNLTIRTLPQIVLVSLVCSLLFTAYA